MRSPSLYLKMEITNMNTENQIIETYNKLRCVAKDLGLVVNLNNGFSIFRGSTLLEHCSTTKELGFYIGGYKAAQIQAAMDKP